MDKHCPYKSAIFNAYKTNVFFKCLPDKTLTCKNNKCHRAKRRKGCFTILLGGNMTGTEK